MPQHTTAEVAELVGGTLDGPGDLAIDRLATLTDAEPGCLTFINEEAYAPKWADSRATAALAAESIPLPPVAGGHAEPRAVIRVDDADLAMAKVLEAFAPPDPTPPPGVHPTAVVADGVDVPGDARIGPHCVVEPGAVLGRGVVLLASAYVGHGAAVGDASVLHPFAAVRHGCSVGRRCVLHAGAVIGGDGFGYRPEPTPQGPRVVKVPHLGGVRLGDDVEIGCNTTIDRGKFADATVGDACKIDNLVQVGHNAAIGRMVMIAGATGIAGSVTIGDGAVIGGMVAVKDHLTLGPGCQIAGGTQLMNDVPAGETWAGSPGRLMSRAAREYAAGMKLPELFQRVKKLERAAAKP